MSFACERCEMRMNMTCRCIATKYMCLIDSNWQSAPWWCEPAPWPRGFVHPQQRARTQRCSSQLEAGKMTSPSITDLTERPIRHAAVTAHDTFGERSGYSSHACATIPSLHQRQASRPVPSWGIAYVAESYLHDLRVCLDIRQLNGRPAGASN